MRIPVAPVIAVMTAASFAVGAGVASAQVNVIAPTSINGVGTGKGPAAYRSAFGRSRTDRLEGNITRLVFNGKQTEVYFSRGRGTAIVTGNSAFRTASGVGPCSTYAELKAAFPHVTRISGTGGIGWKAGRLWFRVGDGTPNPDLTTATVSSVMLVSAPPPPLARTFLGNSGSSCR